MRKGFTFLSARLTCNPRSGKIRIFCCQSFWRKCATLCFPKRFLPHIGIILCTHLAFLWVSLSSKNLCYHPWSIRLHSGLKQPLPQTDVCVAWNRATEGITFAQNVFTTLGCSCGSLIFISFLCVADTDTEETGVGVNLSVSHASESHVLTLVISQTL